MHSRPRDRRLYAHFAAILVAAPTIAACGSTTNPGTPPVDGGAIDAGSRPDGAAPADSGARDGSSPSQDAAVDAELPPADGSPATDGSPPSCAELGGTCQSSGTICTTIATTSCGDPGMYACCAPPEAPDASSDAGPPPEGGTSDGGRVWTGPPPGPGQGSCEVYNPNVGGGCVCEESAGGHLYSLTCEDDAAPCTCAVDGVAKKQVANSCESDPSAFMQACGFP